MGGGALRSHGNTGLERYLARVVCNVRTAAAHREHLVVRCYHAGVAPGGRSLRSREQAPHWLSFLNVLFCMQCAMCLFSILDAIGTVRSLWVCACQCGFVRG